MIEFFFIHTENAKIKLTKWEGEIDLKILELKYCIIAMKSLIASQPWFVHDFYKVTFSLRNEFEGENGLFWLSAALSVFFPAWSCLSHRSFWLLCSCPIARYQETFDSVPHNLLIQKLEKLKCCVVHFLIYSFKKRLQCININQSISVTIANQGIKVS